MWTRVDVSRLGRDGNVGTLDGGDDGGCHHVGVSVGGGTAVFQPALPAIFDGRDRNPDGRAAVRNAVAELVDRLSFVQTRQTLIVVSTVDVDVFLDPWLEGLANGFVNRLAAAGTEQRIAEVGVHAAAVPVTLDWLAVPIDRQVVSFGNSFQKVTSNPDLVTSGAGSLGEDLEFPLPHHHFGVDPFDVDPGLQAEFEVIFDDFATDSLTGTNRAVVRTLGGRVAFRREADRAIGFGVPNCVFLFEAEPEILVFVLNGRPTVGAVGRTIGVEDFAHHQKTGSHPTWIGENGDGLQEAIARAAGSLLGAGTVERPHRCVFDIPAEIFNNLCLATQALGWLIAIQPDVLELALGHESSPPIDPNTKWNVSRNSVQ